MSRTREELLTDVLELPASERGALAAQVIESLGPEIIDHIGEEWDAEIQRRLKEIDAGTVCMIPWEEARRVIRGVTDGTAAD